MRPGFRSELPYEIDGKNVNIGAILGGAFMSHHGNWHQDSTHGDIVPEMKDHPILNKDTNFAVSAKLHVFGKETDAEGLEKWVNNQHSDGIFPDAPEVTSSHDIPAASCKSTGHVLAEEGVAPNGSFVNYKVTFEIKGVQPIGEFIIKDFTDTANVNVKLVEG